MFDTSTCIVSRISDSAQYKAPNVIFCVSTSLFPEQEQNGRQRYRPHVANIKKKSHGVSTTHNNKQVSTTAAKQTSSYNSGAVTRQTRYKT